MQNRSESKADQAGRSLFEGWNSPPNLVTYSRIALVVVFIVLDVMAGPWGQSDISLRWVAAILFIVAASTDKLDGWMARRYNQVTELGKLMDPIADKLLICSALIIASIHGEFWWWATALFLLREIGITLMRFLVIDEGGSVIAASQAGKYKTLFECVGLAMLMVPLFDQWAPYASVCQAVILLALVLCLYSGGEYLVSFFNARKRSSVQASESKR